MSGIGSVLARGLAAGAAGTTALDAVTYADMVVRGRPPSEMPERAVRLAAERIGREVPGDADQRPNRMSGLGALSGIGTGLAAGVAAAVFAPVLRRLPFVPAALIVGGAAMAGSDVPMTRLGLTDPRKWSRADWLADAVPHLAYGVVTAWTVRSLSGRAASSAD
jgi:hypothetical protein